MSLLAAYRYLILGKFSNSVDFIEELALNETEKDYVSVAWYNQEVL